MTEAEGLLPVRSINAHTFCPRLFWLEEKAGLFEHNEHTHEGEQAHQRVEKPGGAMPAPAISGKDKGGFESQIEATEHEAHQDIQEDNRPWHTRDLWLSSSLLGVSGKLDLAESRVQSRQVTREEATVFVMPVDTKKGKHRRALITNCGQPMKSS
ncbi:MAG: hypothetical protein GY822_00115 [Deltaproteobacteria bacterium]|nr:hypothetical protein [Deltaproteobacteria bacterium]